MEDKIKERQVENIKEEHDSTADIIEHDANSTRRKYK